MKVTVTKAGAVRLGRSAGTTYDVSKSDGYTLKKLGWVTVAKPADDRSEPLRRERRTRHIETSPEVRQDPLSVELATEKQDPPPAQQPTVTLDPEAHLKALRAKYHEVFDKRPFNGWDAATLEAKIAEAASK